MRIISEFDERLIEQLWKLFQAEWWTHGRSLAQTRHCIEYSQITLGALDDVGDLQGFIRVLTDFTFKALIFDLIVATDYREKGLGNRLMNAIQFHEKLKSVKHFELYCLPELESYYERFGFSTKVGGIQLMRKAHA